MFKLKKQFIFSVAALLCLCSFLCFPTNNASASTETLQEKIVRFTNSDVLDGETSVTIRNFADDVKSGAYDEGLYLSGYPITDEIGKVIPIDLFYTAGLHLHMGVEYGFIVYTYTNNNGISYFSSVLLIDFTFTDEFYDSNTGEKLGNEFEYGIETLLNLFVETSNEQGSSDWVVFKPYTYPSTQMYLKNFLIGAELQNENERNNTDLFYDKQADKGDIIKKATLDYYAVHKPVSSTNFIPLEKWTFDLAVTKFLGILDNSEIPVISNAAGIVNNLYSFYKDIDSFQNAAGQLFNTDQEYFTLRNDPLNYGVLSKEQQKTNPLYNSYARSIYFKQAENMETMPPTAILMPNTDINDDIENGKLKFRVNTQPVTSNSRMDFSIGFEVVLDQLEEYFIGLDGNNNYQFYLVDYPDGHEVVPIFHYVSNRKILFKEPVNNWQDVDGNNSPIPDDHNWNGTEGYLLDENGYALYAFKPKAKGNYRFFFNTNGIMPGRNIYLFRSKIGQQELDWETLALSTRDQLSSNEYLLLKSGSIDRELNYEFNNIEDTYYILYKYSFDYQGEPTSFNACYEFLPPGLDLNTASANFTLGSQDYKFFVWQPGETYNYDIVLNNLANCEITVYEDNIEEDIAEKPYYLKYSDTKVEGLLSGDYKYYIKIKNNDTVSKTGNLVINKRNNITTAGEFGSLSTLEKTYFSLVPGSGTGKYYIGNNTPASIKVFNTEREQLDYLNGYFLEQNKTYFIEIKNGTINSIEGGTVTVSLNDQDITFIDAIQREDADYNILMAYVINGVVQGYDEYTVNATVHIYNGQNIVGTYNNLSFINNKFIVDLAQYFWYDSFDVVAQVIVSTNENDFIYDFGDKGITVRRNYFGTAWTAQSVYEYINIDQTFANQKISIPNTVKVLSVESDYINKTGIYFEIQTRTTPLIFNMKNLYFTAPSDTTAIISYGDLVINCFGSNIIYGGEGIIDGTYHEVDGNPGIEIHSNNLIINGSTLYVYGGKGAKQNEYQDFYNIDPAGNGGTAIECYNVIFNINYMYIKGGIGGNGGRGLDGVDGVDGSGYKSNQKDGADGTDGTDGSYGGDGGHGGMGLWIIGDSCIISSPSFYIYGGEGGNGGHGGHGGIGGKGANGKGGQFIGTAGVGGHGGDGGYNGTGGDYGLGMLALNEYDINKVINLSTINNTTLYNRLMTWASNGSAGGGGTGGQGGEGGTGGTNLWGTKAADGYDGTDMPMGSSGGNPNSYA